MFADNFLRVIDMSTLLGVFPVLMGASKSAPVANEDIARVVVEVLANPSAHAGKRYRPTGPRLLSGQEMSEEIGNAIGRRVRPINLPPWMFLKVARAQRVDAFEAISLIHYMNDHRRGVFSFEGGVTEVVCELTGAPAETFQTTAKRYAALPFARRTTANRLRALFNLSITPLFRGYNVTRYEREHGFPFPSNPTLSSDSERWKREHLSQADAGFAALRTGATQP